MTDESQQRQARRLSRPLPKLSGSQATALAQQCLAVKIQPPLQHLPFTGDGRRVATDDLRRSPRHAPSMQARDLITNSIGIALIGRTGLSTAPVAARPATLRSGTALRPPRSRPPRWVPRCPCGRAPPPSSSTRWCTRSTACLGWAGAPTPLPGRPDQPAPVRPPDGASSLTALPSWRALRICLLSATRSRLHPGDL
jgi:hypothetical protein